MAPDDSVVAENLTKQYPGHRALDGVSLSVGQGEVLALLGPNGAGKSTTVGVLTTLLEADGGNAWVAGFDVRTEPMEVRRRIAVTGQATSVDDELTGAENLQLICRLLHLPNRQVRRRTADMLERFDLVDAANRPAKTYSGGMRRRLDLAACLVSRPQILFLDEPTTGLDPASRSNLWDAVEAAATEGVSVVLTTQYLEEADALSDRVVVISQGRVVAEGTPALLKQQVGEERLVVTMAEHATWDTAVRLLAPHSAKSLILDERRRTIVIPSSGRLRAASAAAAALEEARLDVESFALRGPTLDEVFLQLTGSTQNDTLSETA